MKYYIKKIFPNWAIEKIKLFIFKIKLLKIQHNHSKALQKVKKKDRITVAFFLIHSSVWKYDRVYNSLKCDDHYDPVIIVCPYMDYGEQGMQQEMSLAYNKFKVKGYKVLKTLNNGVWLDVKKTVNPDIIFFTNPHKITKDEYLITNYLDKLTCYVPYNFGNCHLLNMFHNQPFHNYLWKLFAETEIHKQFSVDLAFNKGVNVIVTGFPGTDELNNKNYKVNDVWKKSNFGKKRIIWAPHHTIDNNKSFLSFSSFLQYSDLFLDLAICYKDSIQLAFKPHPILRHKLYIHESWGIERTEKYYQEWQKLDNCQLEEGDYIDLFLTSDAMIHDSGSFLIEYLYTTKPVLRTDRDDAICDRLNKFGKMAYEMHYHAKSKFDIERFILDVINGNDPMKFKRIMFKNQWLYPPNRKSASENIIDELNKCLFS